MRKILLSLSLALLSTHSGAGQNILVFGDSLSAGYGLAKQDAWPSLLGTRLKDKAPAYSVFNASISGETTAGGLSRFDFALKQTKPSIVIIELGANDGLRGLPLANMQANLSAMIQRSQKAGAKVVLVGIRLPPNYGKDYTEKFAASFASLSKQYKTALVPYLFEGLSSADAFQADRLHPNAASQAKMLETVWKELKPLLK